MKSAAALGLMLLAATAAKAQVTCETEMVPMRDGTRLYTEIYKPAALSWSSPSWPG
jgi:predicted acyl esterase